MIEAVAERAIHFGLLASSSEGRRKHLQKCIQKTQFYGIVKKGGV